MSVCAVLAQAHYSEAFVNSFPHTQVWDKLTEDGGDFARFEVLSCLALSLLTIALMLLCLLVWVWVSGFSGR